MTSVFPSLLVSVSNERLFNHNEVCKSRDGSGQRIGLSLVTYPASHSCRFRSPEIGSRPRSTAGAHLDPSPQRDLAELPAQWRGLPSRAPGRNWRSAAPPARAVLPLRRFIPLRRCIPLRGGGCPHCAKLTHLAHLGWSLGLAH